MVVVERWTRAMNFPVVRNHDISMHPFAHFPPLPPEEQHPAGPEYGNRDDREDGEKEQTNQQDHAHHHCEQAHPPRTPTTERLIISHYAPLEFLYEDNHVVRP